MHNYDTVSEAINDLISRGYTKDLTLVEGQEGLFYTEGGLTLSPADLEVDEVYRFEGDTDPGDEMIVFALSSKRYSIKGVWANAFGIYADERALKIIEQLK